MLGPISNASHNPTQITTPEVWVLLVCGGLIGTLFYWRRKHRINAIRALATRWGFTYIGEALPRSVSLRGTRLEGITAVWNVIDGECRKIRIIAFDCRIGVGKGSWRRTVIAAQTDSDILESMSISRDLAAERSGNWTYLYQPKAFFIPAGLMSVDEIEARLNAIA